VAAQPAIPSAQDQLRDADDRRARAQRAEEAYLRALHEARFAGEHGDQFRGLAR
jgi:cation transport regulator ChaB